MNGFYRGAAVFSAALALAGQAEGRTAGRLQGGPVVVELYTAQGCSTCPKANRAIGALADEPDVLPLTFSVDYWDYLGWSDTFAQPAFTERQRAFVARLKVREIYTPEVVVEGDAEAPALEGARVSELVDAAKARRWRGPRLRLRRNRTTLELGAGSAPGPLDVWLVRYEPGPVSVVVKSGENKGQTVTLRNAVRELKRLGSWRGSARDYPLPPAGGEGVKAVVLLEKPKGGRIMSAARLDGS